MLIFSLLSSFLLDRIGMEYEKINNSKINEKLIQITKEIVYKICRNLQIITAYISFETTIDDWNAKKSTQHKGKKVERNGNICYLLKALEWIRKEIMNEITYFIWSNSWQLQNIFYHAFHKIFVIDVYFLFPKAYIIWDSYEWD